MSFVGCVMFFIGIGGNYLINLHNPESKGLFDKTENVKLGTES